MSPFDKIAAQYAAHPKEESFDRYVMHYHRVGFVFSRPDFFCMGRPVVRSASPSEILDPRHLFDSTKADCWYVHAAAGNMARMFQVVPWELGWFCWTRIQDPLSELQFHPTETIKRLCPPDLNNIHP